MSTTQHTPGPWKAGRQHRDTGNLEIAAPRLDTLIAVAACEEWGYGGKTSRKQTAANARLIAAAPRMLAALYLALERLEICSYDRDEAEAIAEIEATIIEATRQQGGK